MSTPRCGGFLAARPSTLLKTTRGAHSRFSASCLRDKIDPQHRFSIYIGIIVPVVKANLKFVLLSNDGEMFTNVS